MINWGRQTVLSFVTYIIGNLISTTPYTNRVPWIIVMGWGTFLWFAFSFEKWVTSVDNQEKRS